MLLDLSCQATLAVMERLLMAAVRERLLDTEERPDGLTLRLVGSGVLFVPTSQRYSMGRFDLGSWPLEGGPAGREVRDLATLFELLFPEVPPSDKVRLLAELENGRLNSEESLLAKAVNGIGVAGQGTLADWEGRVWLGHPLHPGARLRSGVSVEDNRRYGPEWQPWLVLPLLEMPRQDLTVHGDLWRHLSALEAQVPGFSEESERVAVPVHPWSAENDLRERFASNFRGGRWSFSSAHALLARPSMSFRSVILTNDSGCETHMKLPVAVQTTGATRTVSVAAAYNGPRLSRFLNELWTHPAVVASGALEGLHLMAEPASFHLADDRQGEARFLSGILRTPQPGARPQLPAAALLEPLENPLFCRLAEMYRRDPLELWSDYVARLLPPLAYLCGQLGVALEAHPQNVVVEFSGPPEGPREIHFHYRDLGGIRLHPELLKRGLEKLEIASSLTPQLYPGSATVTDSARELASKFIYSVLQNHLGELCRAVVRKTRQSERPYWEAVHDVLQRCRPLLGADLSARVFAPDWDLKAMWRMRIEKAITEYTFLPVDNPCRTAEPQVKP